MGKPQPRTPKSRAPDLQNSQEGAHTICFEEEFLGLPGVSYGALDQDELVDDWV